ncbi:MAG TPA: class I SAM-dependent methyltransferase [Spirochaetota bacterium]|nr:class I SAM-dependent methyltransferase [Spirochaetota bacterium]
MIIASMSTKKEKYTDFAEHYDYVLKDIDYEEWFHYLKELMLTYNPQAESVLEIGCGTGKFGAKFSSEGYNIIGVDYSLEMLLSARKRAKNNFKLVCADASKFSFKKKFDFIFCVHDTLNYILDMNHVSLLLENAAACMHQNSIFIFDSTTEYNILSNFDKQRSDYYHKGCYIKWENVYDRKKRIITSKLRFLDDNKDTTEEHLQRIHSENEILSAIKRSPLELITVFGDYTFEKPIDETVMVNYICKLKR